ncbi:MAG: hypothetical protein QOI31_439 [Solirubrobacterales bacterium]|jgi:hypothetical protein|nr:hypothetical protein [Solirubrobacterales bacterium]
MRAGRLASLTIAALAAGLTFASGASATDLNAPFDSTNEGFLFLTYDQAFETEAIFGPAEHVASGGNPGGHIRFSDPDSGANERFGVFFSPIQPQPSDVGAAISFDMRSTATTNFHTGTVEGQVSLVVASDNGTVYCTFGAPTASFTHYAMALSADSPCLKDGNDNTDATTEDVVNAVTAESGTQLYVYADFSYNAGEVADLDNFIFDGNDPAVEREITLKYNDKSKTFSGKVTGGDEECTSGVEVQLFKKGAEAPLDSDLTAPTGKFKIAKKAKKGTKYTARAPEFAGESQTCGEAVSKTVKG